MAMGLRPDSSSFARILPIFLPCSASGLRMLSVRSVAIGAALLKLWQKHPDRILSTLLLGNTLVNVGMGAITALMADEIGLSHGVAIFTGLTTVVILLFGEITPKTFAKRHATGFAVFMMPLVALVYWVLF